MLHRLRTLIRKEFLSYARDPRSRVILIGPPFVQLFVFSVAVTLEVSNVGVAILNEDQGRWSQELISRIESSSFVDELIMVQDIAQLTNLVDERETFIGIRFAADFSRHVVAGQSSSVQVLIDGRRANAGQIAFNYVAEIARTLGIELASGRQGRILPPRASVRHWFNPNLEYQWFVVPGLAAAIAMLMALVITALSIARERELGTFDQLLVSPISPIEIVIGKTVPPMLLGAFLSGLMIAAGVFVFDIPFVGSIPLLFGGLLLFILSVVGVGLTVSSIAQTQQQAILGAFMCAVPVILTSGFATPVENMPTWLQTAAEANPMKHFLIIVQGSFLKALPPEVVAEHAIPLALIALVTLSVATFFVRGRLQ